MSRNIYDDEDEVLDEDTLGMKVTSGTATLERNEKNMIGISIGGGAPYCPCLYVVQIFDNTPAAKDGSLAAGDELVAINGKSVKGFAKGEVAKLIQQSPSGPVTIHYNKLHADPKQGKSLDIVLKKVKHKIVENISSSTADALGLSRAILTNDSLVKRHNELERIAQMYKGLVDHSRKVLKAFFSLSQVHREFGNVFSCIGVREPLPGASEAFTKFGNAHRNMEKYAIETLKKLKPMISDLNTYLTKAVPDTRLTIKKYLSAKFEYLSYCLKVKEMDDEEYSYNMVREPLYRVETGNYEYRLVLRCRQEARKQFARLRADVLVKIELLDNKHVQDTVVQLQKFVSAIAQFHTQCYEVMQGATVFPIEVELFEQTFSYNPSGQINDGLEEEGIDASMTDQMADLNLDAAASPASHSVDDLLDLN
ncbi:PRKCA-binding protein-like [Watersipora subatra]|uniref:PRKCA-binding protein-like n=1 Tax=Watersipora subatra TaxID=2589382 RepID=UPI00355BEA88